MTGRNGTDLLTVKEAAERLGVSEKTIRRYMYHRKPGLKYQRHGYFVLIDSEDLDDFIDNAKEDGTPIKAIRKK